MKLLLFFLLITLFYSILQLAYSAYYIRKANQLNKKTFVGERTLGDLGKPVFRLFIAGDSVGAGVGASSFENSVAGRLGKYFANDNQVIIENISVVGERMENLKERKLPAQKQDLIVLIISSNDLFHFSDLDIFEKDTEEVIKKYSLSTKKLVLVGPGNIAEPAAIPLILKPIYSIQGPKYGEKINKIIRSFENSSYVNPIKPPKNLGPYQHTYAADNFHPNDEGHRYWFDMIRSSL